MLEKALNEYRRCLRLDPESRDGRLAYAGVYRLLGYPAKYRQELEVLRRLGFQDTAVTDGIEIVDSQLLDTVAASWGLDAIRAGAQGLQPGGLLHPPGGPGAAPLRRPSSWWSTSRTSCAASTRCSSRRPSRWPRASRRPSAGRAALGADYFLILRFEESERSFSAELEQYLGRTGTRVASYRAFRTGNDRVQDCLALLTTAAAGGAAGLGPAGHPGVRPRG